METFPCLFDALLAGALGAIYVPDFVAVGSPLCGKQQKLGPEVKLLSAIVLSCRKQISVCKKLKKAN